MAQQLQQAAGSTVV